MILKENQEIGSRLKKARKNAKLKQKEAATALGLGRSQIGHFEKGISGVSAVQLIKLAKLYNVAVTQLLPGSDLLAQPKSMDDLLNIIKQREFEITELKSEIRDLRLASGPQKTGKLGRVSDLTLDLEAAISQLDAEFADELVKEVRDVIQDYLAAPVGGSGKEGEGSERARVSKKKGSRQ